MKFFRLRLAFLSLLIAVLNLPFAAAHATAPSLPPLAMREVKITGDEFVVLQANQDIADLSNFWLSYSSLDTATNIVPTQQLPAIKLLAGQAVLLTSDGVQTCDAVYTTKLSASLSDTKGTLEIRQLTNTDQNTSTFGTIDSVTWAKPTATGSTADNLDLRKETGVANPVWYHDVANPGAAWNIGDFENCSLTTLQAGSTPAQTYAWETSTADPPSIIVSLAPDDSSDTAATPSVPAADIGLTAPQITELLPNPDGTGNDDTDEFIELYNGNAASFDLSNFLLQTGATTKHSFAFPAGTSLPPKSFVAFYSSDTGLSLSNTSGAADLEDPLGKVINQTDSYGTAKDGMAWALAKGTWYWTTQPTPSAANVIKQVGAATTSSTKSKKTTSGASGTSGSGSSSAGSSSGSASNAALQVTPIHPWTLAVVAILAVAYGIYEYRLDLANRLYRLKRHYADRRSNRQAA